MGAQKLKNGGGMDAMNRTHNVESDVNPVEELSTAFYVISD